MTTQRITRRTKLGYTDACDVTRPDYSGTIAQLTRVRSDRSYNGGTWFIYVDGKPVKITDILFDYKISNLTDKHDGKYHSDEIFVEVEAE